MAVVLCVGGTGQAAACYLDYLTTIARSTLGAGRIKEKLKYIVIDPDISLLGASNPEMEYSQLLPGPEGLGASQGKGESFEDYLNPSCDNILRNVVDVFFTEGMKECRIQLGFYGMPTVGAVVLEGKLREHSGIFSELLGSNGDSDIIIVGSLVGGTGASIIPTLMRKIRNHRPGCRIRSILFLEHFRLPHRNDGITNDLLHENGRAGLSHLRGLGADMPEVILIRHRTGPLIEYREAGEQSIDRRAPAYYVAAACIHNFIMADRAAPGIDGTLPLLCDIAQDDVADLQRMPVHTGGKDSGWVSLSDIVTSGRALCQLLFYLECFLDRLHERLFAPMGAAFCESVVPGRLDTVLRQIGNGVMDPPAVASELAQGISSRREEILARVSHAAEIICGGKRTQSIGGLLRRPGQPVRKILSEFGPGVTTIDDAVEDIAARAGRWVRERYVGRSRLTEP